MANLAGGNGRVARGHAPEVQGAGAPDRRAERQVRRLCRGHGAAFLGEDSRHRIRRGALHRNPPAAPRGDDEIGLDLLGANNGRSKTVVAAEVKRVRNRRELEKFVRNLRRFFQFFPHWKGYKRYGVLAAVDSSRHMDEAALARGLAVARMHGEVFQLQLPVSFGPKDYAA